jgi:hypothetical protein
MTPAKAIAVAATLIFSTRASGLGTRIFFRPFGASSFRKQPAPEHGAKLPAGPAKGNASGIIRQYKVRHPEEIGTSSIKNLGTKELAIRL